MQLNTIVSLGIQMGINVHMQHEKVLYWNMFEWWRHTLYHCSFLSILFDGVEPFPEDYVRLM